jgi:hypothetical protein
MPLVGHASDKIISVAMAVALRRWPERHIASPMAGGRQWTVGSRSASVAVYRPQAELFGGRSDGKFGVP